MSEHPAQPTPWKILSSQELVQTPWFTLRRDACEVPGGKIIDDYYVMEGPQVISVVALTPEKNLILNNQYKHGIGRVVTEIPGGIIDGDEEPLSAAQRELEEETGYVGGEWHSLGTMIASASRDTTLIHFFLALNVVPGGKLMNDPREEIITELFPWDEISDAIRTQKVQVLGSIAGIHLAQDWLTQHSHE